MKQKKWRSAEEKAKHEKLQKEWESIKAYHSKTAPKISKARSVIPAPILKPPPGRSTNRHIPSLDTGSGVGSKKESIQYTGDKMLGVGMLHKSNLVPVFSESEAKDQASMRR